MGRQIRLLVMVASCAASTLAAAQAPAAAPPAWTSMSRAGVTSALPAQAPMAAELTAHAPPPQWADVALPPPPSTAQKEPGAFQPPAFAAPGAALPAAGIMAAGGEKQGAASEPQVKFAADQTGAMVSITQDLESDRVRQNWAAQGGQLPAYEANAGVMLMYKDMSDLAEGAYMSGVGFSGGIRVALLNLTPPKYETRDRSWFAFKIGGGIDLGVMGVTMDPGCAMGYCPGPTSASMTSLTLVGTIGVMKAFGSFDSPSDWSGYAIGVEWAPSYQSTTLTIPDSPLPPTTTSDFNATGFAFNFESGSMKAMAMKMGKKARFKLRLFFLPPVGELPFLMTGSVGAVWY
jgi:hypothetical protein